jgi:hypothetical protein
MSILETQTSKLTSSLHPVVALAVVVCFLAFPLRTSAQGPGAIVGHIDRVTFDGTNGTVIGWACQQGRPESIGVQVFGDGELLAAGKADLENEPGVYQVCHVQGGKHRFAIVLPNKPFADGQEKILTVRGIRVAGNVENAAIAGSGATRFRLPTAVPGVRGSYISSSTYPRVFNTPSELEDFARRMNTSGTYSATRFRQLATQVGRDLASGKEWGTAYAGCNSDTYNYAFSYEPQVIEHDDHTTKVSEDLNLQAGAKPPGGAAVVAARDALYAALVKAGASVPAGGPPADRAAALAKQVLMAWSSHGFRDDQGRFLNSPKQFCGGDGKFSEGASAGSGLVVARGILYSVQTRDLLTYLGLLNEAETKQVNSFHSAMFDLILNALNYNYVEQHAWDCDHYSNHAANLLAGLLALARDLDRPREFEAVLNGKDPSIHTSLFWAMFFQRAIYGDGDIPNACYANTGKDGNTSRPFFQTSVVAPGEIDDRYRNADPGKGIGYPMFTLERLYDAAEVMRNAGFDGYGYRGLHKQSIEMATAYYACLAKGAGFFATVTPENSASCPDAEQYYGKIVNGVERMVVIGGLRFPNDNAIMSVEPAAEKAASSGVFSLDSILFGRWQD